MVLSFRPNIALITSTRRYVAELFDSILSDPDATSRVALTIHELLENTLKYSTDGVASLEVGLDGAPGNRVVKICASNRATPAQLDVLCRQIDSLRDLGDPMAVYVELLLEAASREQGSGLGLARIRVEAEMDLTYSVDGDRITITAATPVQMPATETVIT